MRGSRLGALTVLLVLCTASANVLAHAELERSRPAAGSTVHRSPQEVDLWFSEALEPVLSMAKVFNAAGKRVDGGRVRVDAKNPELMHVPLAGHLPAGRYRVIWRSVATDSHKEEGSFTFTVQP